MANTIITIETTVSVSPDIAWEYFTKAEHVLQWNAASDEWHSPRGEADVRTGGTFNFRMEARDGSMGFDFSGVYDEIVPGKLIRYTLGDGRKVQVDFIPVENGVRVVESFEAENTHPVEFQKAGWQAILDNYKRYAESA